MLRDDGEAAELEDVGIKDKSEWSEAAALDDLRRGYCFEGIRAARENPPC